MAKLIEFYGKECPHCEKMEGIVRRLREEDGILIEQVEVWHDEQNMKRAEECDKRAKCGGVPFFFDEETGKALCGEATYEDLKAWALGQ